MFATRKINTRSTTTKDPLTADLELFRGMSQRDLLRCGKYFTLIDVAPGKSLGRQGDQCQEFIVVSDGRVAVTFDEVPVAVLDPGCFFGEVPLLDTTMNHTRRASVSALETCRLAVANPREFSGLLHEFPQVAARIREVAQRRIAYVEQLVAERVDAAHIDIEYPVHVQAQAD